MRQARAAVRAAPSRPAPLECGADPASAGWLSWIRDGAQVQVENMDARADYLVLGASGAIGTWVLPALMSKPGVRVVAVSRRPPEARHPGLAWERHDLYAASGPASGAMDARHVIGAGPLDGLAALAERAAWRAGTRVAALSSMSLLTKRDSPDPAERASIARLGDAERRLRALAQARGWHLSLLRPTLVWGSGLDRSLTPLVSLARRWGVLPLPAGARGLRQPVHASDLAAALLVAAEQPAPAGTVRTLAMPGGEVLPFDRMLARCLAVAAPHARLLRLPDLPARVLGGLMRRLPGRSRTLAVQLARARADLHVEGPSGWSELGLSPRRFDPHPEDFVPRVIRLPSR